VSLAVVVRGVDKRYRDGVRTVEVLHGIDLEVVPGERLGIVGPSGSGKSTLLHLLGGLDRPDSGEIVIGGTPLAGLSAERLAYFRNRTIGFVFQFHQLLADFTALENVMLPGRIAGIAPREIAGRARDLLERVGLAEREDHFPSQLSGGEQQRVALCRALLLEPPLLLADEPTGSLDPQSGSTVVEMLENLQRGRGTTAIVVTHNPAVAARCDRILSLEGGRLTPEAPDFKALRGPNEER
jgi:predicted ABC-type transport system involved in lysophospholipase L1 biosynthesis ATPase subunit